MSAGRRLLSQDEVADLLSLLESHLRSRHERTFIAEEERGENEHLIVAEFHALDVRVYVSFVIPTVRS